MRWVRARCNLTSKLAGGFDRKRRSRFSEAPSSKAPFLGDLFGVVDCLDSFRVRAGAVLELGLYGLSRLDPRPAASLALNS
jgi:hypothetical protein